MSQGPPDEVGTEEEPPRRESDADHNRWLDEHDPLSVLIRALDRDGRPSLAWVLRWGAGRLEPVAGAYAASRHEMAMYRMWSWTDPEGSYRARREAYVATGEHGCSYRLGCAECLGIYRALLPVPPTLPALITAWAARRRGE